MITSNTQKIVLLTPPQARVNNGAVAVAAVDAKGYDYLDIVVVLGDTDAPLTAVRDQQSDTNNGFVDTPIGALAILPAATDDNSTFALHCNMLGKKRYHRPVVTVGNGATGAFVAVLAILSRAKEMPNNATERGFAGEAYF